MLGRFDVDPLGPLLGTGKEADSLGPTSAAAKASAEWTYPPTPDLCSHRGQRWSQGLLQSGLTRSAAESDPASDDA